MHRLKLLIIFTYSFINKWDKVFEENKDFINPKVNLIWIGSFDSYTFRTYLS